MNPKPFCCVVLAALIAPWVTMAQPEVSAERTESGVRVMLDGALCTEYFGTGAQRPYLYPLIGPSGANLARPYPMEKGGAEDHPHHRSFWFAHGSVNGVDFWTDGSKHGRQVHLGVKDVKSDANGVSFTTETEWRAASGKMVLKDERLIHVSADPDGGRIIDFTIRLKTSEGEVVFGDTKEGTLAIRVGPTLSMVGEGALGGILLQTGQKGKAAWGKKSPWACFYGPDAKGELVCLTLLDHPENLRHPTWWHVRDYGLFAANPFGKHDFEKLEDKKAGEFRLAKGETLTLRYRLLLSAGKPDAARFDEEWKAFAQPTTLTE